MFTERAPDDAEFCNFLDDHMLETWLLGHRDTLFGSPVTRRKRHSERRAAAEFSIDKGHLRKMLTDWGITDWGITSEEQKGRPGAWCTFDVEASRPILQDLVTLLDAKAYREFFGLGRSQFDLLVEDGLLVLDIQSRATKARWNPRIGRAPLQNVAKPFRKAS